MEISHMHPLALKDSLPDSVYHVYSDTYEKVFSFYRAHGNSCMSVNTKAEIAGWTAVKCKFSHLIK